MNILFYYNSTLDPLTGGIGRVSNVLSDYFENKDHSVFFLSKVEDSSFSSSRQFYLPDKNEYLSRENIEFFRDFLKNKKIDVVINQSAMNRDASRLVYYAKRLGIPIVSVIHNTLLGSIENFSTFYYERFRKWKLHRLLPITDYKIVKKAYT